MIDFHAYLGRACQQFARIALPCYLAVSVSSSAAIEPWADARLKLTSGLTAWYDASVQNAARGAAEKNAWKDDSRVDVWQDGSGAKRDLVQPVKEMRPIVR